MTKLNIENTSEYKNLLNNQVVVGLVRNRISRQSVDNYFNWVKEKYPTATTSIDNLLKQKERDLNEAISLQQGSTIRSLIFDILEASREEIRSQSRQRLNQLFTQTMSLNFQTVDKKEVDNLEINNRIFYDTSDVAFLVNGLIEEVFFNLVPRELEKELNREPKVQLSELPSTEWNTKRNELLSIICTEAIGRGLPRLEKAEEEINEKYQELTAIIQNKRTEKISSIPVCNTPQHQQLQSQHDDLKKQNTKLGQEKTELEQLKKAKLEATKKVNDSWHNAIMIDRGEKERLLGENWDEELLKKTTPEKIVEEQNRLVKLIKDREEVEKQNQKKFEKEIEDKIKEARNFNASASHLIPEELLKTLEDFRDKWGSSEQATPAQWRAFLSHRNDLNREIASFSVTVTRNGAIREIRAELGSFKSDDLLVESKHINFRSTLSQLRTTKEINDFENEVLKNIIALKPSRSRLIQLVGDIQTALREDNHSLLTQEKCFKFCAELERYRNSPSDSIEYKIYHQGSAVYNRLDSQLLAKARGFASSNLSESKKTILDSEKVNELTRQAIEQLLKEFQLRANRANLQDLQTKKHERDFERAVYQSLIKEIKQEAKVIDNPPPKGSS